MKIRLTLGAALAASIFCGIASSPATAQGFGMGGPMGGPMGAKMKAWQDWRAKHKSIGELQRIPRGLGNLDESPDTALSKAQATKLAGILKSWRNKPMMTDAQADGVMKQIHGILNAKQNAELAKPPSFGGFGGGRRGGPGGPGGFGGRPGGPPGGPGGFGGRPGGPPPGGPGGPPPGGFGGRPGGPPPGGPGGPPGGFGGRPGGPPGGPGGFGGRGGFQLPDPPKGTYNPLNPEKSPMGSRGARRLDELIGNLEKHK